MATITTEFGKLSSNKTRTVYLRVRNGKLEKRINTQIKVAESEISPRTKKIKNREKAMFVEMMRLEWEAKICIQALKYLMPRSKHSASPPPSARKKRMSTSLSLPRIG